MRENKTLILVWIFAVGLVYSVPQDCTEWFGTPCIYKCRCATGCQSDGTCIGGGACQQGWFGPACQYADVANAIPVTVQPGGTPINYITDNNDATCNTDATSQSLTLTWNQKYHISWLRVYAQNIGALPSLTLQFNDSSSAAYVNCNKNIIFNSPYTDIYCDLTVPVNQVTLTGEVVKSLCSLYISGGRNLALNQKTSQSSTYLDYNSDKAVDGNTDGIFYGSKSCTATDGLSDPYWFINISQPMTVYRYVLYNVIDVFPQRLQAFQLKSFDVNSALIDDYVDKSSSINQSVYTVVPVKASMSVSRVDIHGVFTDKVLTLCEVEIYGETECAVGSYGLDCQNKCNCANSSETCYASTGWCPLGCAPGFFGESCWQRCDAGWCGTSCQYKCHCNTTCDNYGTCINGSRCQTGWFGPACQYADLATSVIKRNQLNDLIDGNDKTCNTLTTSQNLTLSWNQAYLFTWLRFYIKDMLNVDEITGSLSYLTVLFRRVNSTTFLNTHCQKIVTINNPYIDMFCDLAEPTNQVILIGEAVKSLCSVYISGGRNVALRQQTSQSSTYTGESVNHGSERAVDGDNSGDFTKGCTCTDGSDVPYWTITMSRPVTVYRYVLYNRIDRNQVRLQGFKVTSYTAQGASLYNYTDMSGTQNVYTVIPDTPTLSVSRINIQGTSSDKFLTVCEAEIYGETDCPAGRYGRECENTCNCANGSEACYISTGGCLSGCDDGYFGENCKQRCDTGWFGTSCRYKCHCNTPCNNNGSCTNGGRCKTGWFGPACQYVDLAIRTIEGVQIPELIDGNDTTCNRLNTAQNLTLTWNQTYHLTWLRVYTRNMPTVGSLSDLEVQFIRNGSTTNLNVICHKIVTINNSSMDIFCDLTVPVNQVILTGEAIKSLCSIYISGGRNIALHQITSQSGTFVWGSVSYGSDKAVDGNTDGNFYNSNTCTATESLSNPYWSITISRPVTVYRYVLYNSDSYQYRLQGFELTSFNVTDAQVYSYKESSATNLSVYTVVPETPSESVSHIQIQKAFSRNDALILCEVEIYGETECVPGRYGRECDNTCNCADSREKCYVSTGGCQSGCATGFHGENCKQPCPDGTYGNSCKYHCAHCASYTSGAPVCDRFNGICLQGCQNGYASIFCNQSCPEGKFGANCSYDCPDKCARNSPGMSACDNINGTCLNGCQDGYISSMCNQSCQSGKYGPGCVYNCSEFCASVSSSSSTCNNTDGSCLNKCMPGYHGRKCDANCTAGKHGKDCQLSCSEYCVLNNNIPECDHIIGTCECQSGYSTPWCNDTCSPGMYGKGCMTPCSAHCVHDSNKTCHHIKGSCECQDGYVAPLCNEMQVNNPPPAGAIAGAVIGGAVAALIAVGVAFILWRRKKAKSLQTTGTNRNGDFSAITKRGTELNALHNAGHNQKEQKTKRTANDGASGSNTGVYYNTLQEASSTSTVIQLDDLEAFLATHNKSFYQEQFSTIPINSGATTEVAQKPENKKKNRYKNICAYDHSRVHLMTSENHEQDDYINASHIQGYNGENFIASQGPTKSTLEDFVRMLWEQQTEEVVMLTNLIEQGKDKCERYWPEDGEIKIGEITVKLTTSHVFADYIIRRLQLGKAGKQNHVVTHFHFTAWPDLDVPVTPWGLVEFEQRVASYPTSKPIVVHCSAGVGRTGTFIALRNIMRQAEDKGHLDIFTTVQKLRHDRINMVQTSIQYQFLHRAAHVAMLCLGTTVTSGDIEGRINYLRNVSDSGVTNMEKEFRTICNLSTDDDVNKDVDESEVDAANVYENSHMVTNKQKNRLNNIIPKALYAPILQCETDYLGDYINAVFVPSFSKQNQQFLTQLPLPTTVTDFWRLVTQFKVSLIVSFEDDLKHTDMTIGQYLPSNDKQPVTFSLFELESETVSTNKLWQQRKVTITADTEYKNTKLSNSTAMKEEFALTHLKCMTTDLDPENMLALIGKIRSLNPGSESRTVYTCRNGADYSGLVCVLSLLLDRIDHDGCSAVPLVVGAIKAIRPQVIPTLAQYQLLYQVLRLYNERNNVYANLNNTK